MPAHRYIEENGSATCLSRGSQTQRCHQNSKMGFSSPSKRLQNEILGGLVKKICRGVIALLLVVSQIKVMALLGTC